MRHIISILIENEAGALSRVSGLFSARGFNIESLTVAPTEDASLSRMTIVSTGSDEVIEQITKQLNKLIDVVKVVDLSEAAHIERELMLVKVRATGKDREEMKRIADIFRGRIIDVTDSTYVIELTGNGSKLDAFLEAIDRSPDPRNRAHRRVRHRSRRSNSQSLNSETKETHESLLRQGRRPLPDQGQEGHHRWLRLARPCPRPEPEGFRRQGDGRPAQGRRFLGQGQEGRSQGRGSRQGGQGC
jgi:acetolactate synthase-1/3 small subunit